MAELNQTSNEVKPENNSVQATEAKAVETKKEQKVVEVKTKDVKQKKKKEKKPSKIKKAIKDTGAELKKVTWPKFKEVVKQTGIVLAFVLICAVVLFGFDRLCSWLTSFLM